MKINRRRLKVLLIFSAVAILLITIFQIISTYSLLQSRLSGTVQQSIGKWNIELNKQDITNGIVRQIIIDDFSFVEDTNVKEGKIAPGISGMIDLTIDPKDTDVSILYSITLGDIGNLPISIEAIEIIEGTGDLVKIDENTYSGIMSLSSINNNVAKVKVRITVLWENDELNNERDTLIGTQNRSNIRCANNFFGKTIFR